MVLLFLLLGGFAMRDGQGTVRIAEVVFAEFVRESPWFEIASDDGVWGDDFVPNQSLDEVGFVAVFQSRIRSLGIEIGDGWVIFVHEILNFIIPSWKVPWNRVGKEGWRWGAGFGLFGFSSGWGK